VKKRLKVDPDTAMKLLKVDSIPEAERLKVTTKLLGVLPQRHLLRTRFTFLCGVPHLVGYDEWCSL